LQAMLEWQPYVVVLDSALERVLPLNIKIDAVLGDFDRGFDPQYALAHQFPIEIIHRPDQEKTDLEKAFEWLIEKGFSDVHVLWATGKRADHHWHNMSAMVPYRNQLKVVVLDDYSRIFLAPKQFEKWYSQGTILSLVPLNKVEGITTENLVFPLHHESLELGVRMGTSNEVKQDGLVVITHQSGHLLLMECNDEPFC